MRSGCLARDVEESHDRNPAARSHRWYLRGMRAKTSVSLTRELLVEISRTAGPRVNRSEFLEAAAWDRISMLKRRRREARDRTILNRKSKSLNAEALDVLAYQADW